MARGGVGGRGGQGGDIIIYPGSGEFGTDSVRVRTTGDGVLGMKAESLDGIGSDGGAGELLGRVGAGGAGGGGGAIAIRGDWTIETGGDGGDGEGFFPAARVPMRVPPAR